MRGTRARRDWGLRRRGIIPACAGNTMVWSIDASFTRDHPRVCGEHLIVAIGMAVGQGSSPRVRGTRGADRPRDQDAGIIPACAGNTAGARSCTAWRRDHPRVCGEHSRRTATVSVTLGSSPRVRGTLHGAGVAHERVGIIPACAGNTQPGRNLGRRRRDHPRVCGEHSAENMSANAQAGSSPRVRGTPRRETASLSLCGIIPACAGNTKTGSFEAPSSRDHPRVCGEHYKAKYEELKGEGSSPRVRGTLSTACSSVSRLGIIPACAGNTGAFVMGREWTWDHPRVCGEHCTSLMRSLSLSGSSPRVRGTPVERQGQGPVRGIIPACAGNTSTRAANRCCCRDHPRVCGEHSSQSMTSREIAGSSPRVRGTL